MTTDVLTAFSPANEFLAITTADGRVKTWDVGNGHLRGEFVDIAASTSGAGGGAAFGEVNGHLAVDYSCMTWGTLSASSKKAKKKGAKDGLLFVLLLGTGAGDVLAWDTGLGQLKWRANDRHAGGVKSVAFSKNGQTLYTGGADGMICELSIGTGDVLGKFRAAKSSVSCIAVSPDGGSLLTASSELKLFDLSSKKRIRKFAGHPAIVNALAFSGDGKYVLSSAIEDRQVAVWKVEGSKSERGASFSLSLDHPPVALQCSQEDGVCKVVAVSATGAAYIWRAPTVEELATTKPMKVSVAAPTKSGQISGKRVKPSILAACSERVTGEGPETVLIAHGTTAKPKFEHVSLGAAGSQVVLDAEAGGALLPSNTPAADDASTPPKGGAGAAAVTVLGPDNGADAVFSRAHPESQGLAAAAAAASSKKSKKKRQASIDLDADLPPKVPEPLQQQHPAAKADDGDTAPAAAAAPMDEDEDEGQTMEERIIALGIVDKVPGDAETAGMKGIPRANSVRVLLSQALQADDNALLEQCLTISDEKVITNTVRGLRPTEAAKFLSSCISKLESKPRRGLQLVPWLRTVLLQHAASLMSNPAVQPVLGGLNQLIEARLSVFQPLLALSGRLDLIMAQISSSEAKDEERTEDDDAEQVVVYEEGDSEVEVEEVADGGGSSSSEEEGEEDSEEDDENADSEDDKDDDAMESEEEEEAGVKADRHGNGHLSGDDDDDDETSE